MIKNIILVFLAVLVVSCDKKTETKTVIEKTPVSLYKVPAIPNYIVESTEKAEYLMKHYWDNYNFNDTTILNQKMPEQAFADFLHICNNIEDKQAISGMNTFLNYAENDSIVFYYFLKLSDKYLYNPNSPYRNEPLYVLFLKKALSKGLLDETQKIICQKRLDLCIKNNIGAKAEDFTISYNDNSKTKLHKIFSEYLVIYFHNPECDECKNVSKIMQESQLIENLINTGKLNILTVYTDEDLSIWKKHYTELPTNWINTYNNNAEVKNLEIYDLKAIPTLYLLDKNKNVIMKDAKIEDLLFYLGNI